MYPSDMTDEQWEIVQTHFPAGKRAGCPRVRSARDMINAIFYVQATVC
ncbi:transposase [Ottowia sp. oral taxon 894]|nr:transposase [Ottowia sp. oral taxon 894]